MPRFLRHLITAGGAVGASLFLATNALAAGIIDTLQDTGEAGFGVREPRSPAVVVGKIINNVLSVLGILAVVLILYAGFLWMTAAGNEQKVEKARSILTQAVIGLAIILASYAIANFVVRALVNSTTGA